MFAITAGIALTAEKSTIKIEPLKGEKWWGLFVGLTPAEPFLQPFSVNTANDGHAFGLVPMLISSSGRYLWSSSPVEVLFDGKTFTVSSSSEKLQVQRAGRTLREAYLICRHKNDQSRTDKSGSPELFSNIFYETANEIGCLQDEQTILAYADRISREGLPTGYIVIADGWRNAHGDYDFDPTLYPDPKAFVDALHRAGFKVMLTVTPYMPSSGRAYVGNLNSGRLLADKDGKPLLIRNGDGIHTVLNITEQCCGEEVLASLRRIEEQYGIDGFRFDCTAIEDAASRPIGFLNAWQAIGRTFEVHELITSEEAPSSSDPNSGDRSLRNLLSDAISSSLVAGNRLQTLTANWKYESQTQLLRAMQVAAMMPTPHIPYAPWRISNENLYAQLKNTLLLRASLSSYMSQTASEANRTAEPIIRHMEYQFPRCGFADCDNQFMLGDKYLVAPPLDENPQRMVRLPKGIWTDMNGKRYKGPIVINAPSGDGRMICFELQTK